MTVERGAIVDSGQTAGRMRHIALVLSALVVATCFLFQRPDGNSNDFGGHQAYLKHIAREPLSPLAYTGGESWHPPTYYYLAWISEEIGAWIGLPVLKGARILSIVLYLLYIHFGLRTLALLFRGRVFWCASLLFLVWPSNFEMSTRINSDLAIIPVYAAVQFYLVRSVITRNIHDCLRALCISFIGLAFKTSGLVSVGLACLVTIPMIMGERTRSPQKVRTAVAPWLPALLVVVVVCVSINCSRLIVYQVRGVATSALHLGGHRPQPLPVAHLLAVRPWNLLKNPFSEASSDRCSAAEFALKTALFTEQPWLGRGKFLGRVWMVLVLFQVGVVGMFIARRVPTVAREGFLWMRERCRNAKSCGDELQLASKEARDWTDTDLIRWGILWLLALFPVCALLVFAWKQNWTVCSNYRFVQASLVAWTGLLMMPACSRSEDLRKGSWISYIAWLGVFTLATWGIVCLALKIFRPLLEWN